MSTDGACKYCGKPSDRGHRVYLETGGWGHHACWIAALDRAVEKDSQAPQPPPSVAPGEDTAAVLAGLVELLETLHTESSIWCDAKDAALTDARALLAATGARAAGGESAEQAHERRQREFAHNTVIGVTANPWTAQSEDLLPHCAPFPDTPGSRCPDHHAVACPVCLADCEVHDAIYVVQTAQDFESPDAPYQHDVLVFAAHARVLAATLRGFYEALSGEAPPAPSAPGVAELLTDVRLQAEAGWSTARFTADEIVRLLAPGGADGTCSCSPPPDTDGPEIDCPVHGLPPAALHYVDLYQEARGEVRKLRGWNAHLNRALAVITAEDDQRPSDVPLTQVLDAVIATWPAPAEPPAPTHDTESDDGGNEG